MFIFKTTQKRANPYAPYTDANGVRYLKIPLNLLDEIPDPQPPEDYTEETYFRTEQDDAPYVVYTKKSLEILLPIAKLKKYNEINNQRDAQITQNVTVFNRPWQADERSQDLLTKTITMIQFGIPLPPSWRDANNDSMPLSSVTQLVQIAGAIAYNTQVAYNTSWARKAALEAATTVEEVEVI